MEKSSTPRKTGSKEIQIADESSHPPPQRHRTPRVSPSYSSPPPSKKKYLLAPPFFPLSGSPYFFKNNKRDGMVSGKRVGDGRMGKRAHDGRHLHGEETESYQREGVGDAGRKATPTRRTTDGKERDGRRRRTKKREKNKRSLIRNRPTRSSGARLDGGRSPS